MRAWQRRNIFIGFAVIAMLAVGLSLGITASQRPSRPAPVANTVAGQWPSRPASVPETVTIDSNIGETFAPARRTPRRN